MTVFRGNSGNDRFYGGAQSDFATGDEGDDRLYGRGGDDLLVGESGSDRLFGGGNDDILVAGFVGDQDRLYGGGGRDVGNLQVGNATGPLVFALAGGGATSVATLAGSSGAVLVGIEEVEVIGSNAGDTIAGSSGDDALHGGGGKDSLFGGSGADRLYGASATDGDLLDGGSGSDTVAFFGEGSGGLSFDLSTAGPVLVTQGGVSGHTLVSIEAASLTGSQFDDTLGGGRGEDSLSGFRGNDKVYGALGDDSLSGGSGTDYLYGGSGADVLDPMEAKGVVSGGSGADTLRFNGSANASTLIRVDEDLATTFQDLVFSGVEALSFYLRAGEDLTVVGGSLDDRVTSGSGADTLLGRSGNDSLRANDGNDAVYGADGDDILSGGTGTDLIFGGSGDDLISDDANLGVVLGGSGIDTLSVSLSVGSDLFADVQAGGNFQGLFFTEMEALAFTATGDGKLTLRGGDGGDVIRSASGDATLLGRSGDDIILTGDGIASIFGGSGFDVASLRLTTGVGDVFFDQRDLNGKASFADGNRINGVEHLYLLTGSGRDTLFGGSDFDAFDGGGGDDLLRGRGGDDRLATDNQGTLVGNAGNDELRAVIRPIAVYDDPEGDVSLFGGEGDDEVTVVGTDAGVHASAALLEGASGSDRLGAWIENLRYGTFDGGSGDDTISLEITDIGGQYAEILAYGGEGDDTVNGYEFRAESIFSARLYGGSGSDLVLADFQAKDSGDPRDVTLFGDTGADVMGTGTLVGNYFRSSFDIGFSFRGGAGADRIYGEGAGGDDYMRAGTGRDSVFGGSGQDIFVVGEGELRSGEEIFGGSGVDTLFIVGGASAAAFLSLLSVESIEDASTSANDDHLFGNALGNDLRGGSGDDFIYGESGRDHLRGQVGNDRLRDESGNDTLFGEAGDDRMEAGDGRDRLGGGSGVDLLFGESGRDILNGGSGADTAFGGRDNDTFIVDTATDRVVERFGGGDVDVVRSNAGRFNLGSGSDGYIERVIVNEAAGAAEVVGSSIANTILGNAFSNTFFGGKGDDILNGRGSSDTLAGGSGDDTFVVDTATDRPAELNGGGVDLVRAETDFTLPDGGATDALENLRMQGGKGAIDGTGNSLDNTVEGNSASNRLAGNQGADHLLGGGGGDILFGGNGGDTLEGGGGSDTLFVGKDDTAFGGTGGDDFRFNSGALGVDGSGGPLIGDFDGEGLGRQNGADKLVFATGLESGSFSYIGASAFSGDGNSEARFAGNRQVEVDRDGDGAADIFFLVEGLTQAGALTSSDFVWL